MQDGEYSYNYFECDCKRFDHTLRLVWDREDKTLYTELKLNQHLSFWKRLGVAARYVAGRRPGNNYDVWMASGEGLSKLKDFVSAL